MDTSIFGYISVVSCRHSILNNVIAQIYADYADFPYIVQA